MHTVNVSLGDRSYDIEIGTSLEKTGERLAGLGLGRKMALITNPTVKKLYGQRVLDSLKAAGFTAAADGSCRSTGTTAGASLPACAAAGASSARSTEATSPNDVGRPAGGPPRCTAPP